MAESKFVLSSNFEFRKSCEEHMNSSWKTANQKFIPQTKYKNWREKDVQHKKNVSKEMQERNESIKERFAWCEKPAKTS